MPLVVVGNYLAQASESQIQAQQCCCTDEGEEISIVASAHTVVQPDTVVIKSLHTVIAHSTIIASRRPPNVARLAVFHRHVHGCCLRSSQPYHDPVISWGS